MAGSESSRRRPARRDRDRDRDRDQEKPSRDRDRDSSRDSEDRDRREKGGDAHEDRRQRRPAPSRRSTYNDGNGADEHFEEDEKDRDRDRDRRSRASDNKEKRRPSRYRRARSESRSPSRSRSRSRSRQRSRTRDTKRSASRDRPLTEVELKSRRNKAIKAALTAAAFEVFRQKSRPGDWMGQKGVRVATAAISAGLIDAGLDKNPGIAGGTMGRLMTSTLGGMVVDKIANGGSTGRKR